MNQPANNTPDNQPPSLGNTLFMSGICIVMGGVVFLIGIGVIPGGEADPSASARLLAIGAGLLFIFAGFAIIVRDLAGAKNGEEIPANAPFLLRLGGSLLSIVLVAIFATISSVIAFGPFFPGGALPDLTEQMGGVGAAIFRFVNGAFGLLFWYIVIYLIYDKIRKRGA
jgi:hypothetical protein